eukprot:TRINITY_DN58635_c0_g1_i1.p1 TRINITY_DN58635_c0_g1~~TRINITY_DN58635_c0_g1_i1.p1  ORF type:complete len:227 (-),score=38.88 TRINITY_DN58635_c0_g1_i1:117-752(-)
MLGSTDTAPGRVRIQFGGSAPLQQLVLCIILGLFDAVQSFRVQDDGHRHDYGGSVAGSLAPYEALVVRPTTVVPASAPVLTRDADLVSSTDQEEAEEVEEQGASKIVRPTQGKQRVAAANELFHRAVLQALVPKEASVLPNNAEHWAKAGLKRPAALSSNDEETSPPRAHPSLSAVSGEMKSNSDSLSKVKDEISQLEQEVDKATLGLDSS